MRLRSFAAVPARFLRRLPALEHSALNILARSRFSSLQSRSTHLNPCNKAEASWTPSASAKLIRHCSNRSLDRQQ